MCWAYIWLVSRKHLLQGSWTWQWFILAGLQLKPYKQWTFYNMQHYATMQQSWHLGRKERSSFFRCTLLYDMNLKTILLVSVKPTLWILTSLLFSKLHIWVCIIKMILSFDEWLSTVVAEDNWEVLIVNTGTSKVQHMECHYIFPCFTSGTHHANDSMSSSDERTKFISIWMSLDCVTQRTDAAVYNHKVFHLFAWHKTTRLILGQIKYFTL